MVMETWVEEARAATVVALKEVMLVVVMVAGAGAEAAVEEVMLVVVAVAVAVEQTGK